MSSGVTKITITYGPKKKRYEPKEGDRKFIKKYGKWFVRKQRRADCGARIVSNGKPCFQWVAEDEVK